MKHNIFVDRLDGSVIRMAIAPPMLLRGDTVGIVTLGSPLARDVIDARIAYLRSLGFNVVLGNHVYSVDGIVAAPAPQRAADLMDMFRNPRVKAIIPSRGGTGVSDILPYLDCDVIRANPKILTGYSDITILSNVLYQFTDLLSFQSLLLIDFRAETPAYNFNQFFTATTTTTAPRRIENPPGMPLSSLVPGDVTGPIIGGNLTSFIGSLGTPFEIDTRGKILVIEETHEPANTIYRYMAQLRLAGKLRDAIGFVIGECTDCQPAYGETFNDVLRKELVPLGKPILTNLRTAHGIYKAAIPIGAQVNLNTYNNTLTILEPTATSR
jgi:muramoyltetrapeptide carboxypeptidase